MFKHPRIVLALASFTLLTLTAGHASAAYVTPQIGGGQVGMMDGAAMKHADISFDGVNISIHLDDTVATPTLRPLTGTDAFDPAQPWSVLSGMAYNYQYAWNAGGFITLPTGGAIWVERLHHDAGLMTFMRTPQYVAASDGPTWPEIFAADGDRWRWAGAMQHNAFAVFHPTQIAYTATYRVYLGDAITGQPLDGYGDDTVTWTWNASPVPEPASLLAFGVMVPLIGRRRR